MNKKIIPVIIVILVVLVAGVIYYSQYQSEVLTEKYDKGLQDASAIETKVVATTEKINSQESTDADVLINTINNDITPKYSEEIAKLEETKDFANGNDVKTRYVELQCKRLELESKNYNGTVQTLNAISQLVRGEKSQTDAQNSINSAQKDMSESQKELEEVYVDINTLLTQNPDFNQTLQDLHLEKPFYGEKRIINQTQNINDTNTTTA